MGRRSVNSVPGGIFEGKSHPADYVLFHESEYEASIRKLNDLL